MWTLAPPRRTRLEDFRVGVVLDHGRAPVSAEVGALMSGAVDALARAGAAVVEGWPDGLDPVQSSESFGFHVQLFFAFQQPGADVAAMSQVIEHEDRRMAARAAWQRYFSEIDVFVCPVNFTPAFPHDSRAFDERTITTPEGERPYDSQPFWIAHASLPACPPWPRPSAAHRTGCPWARRCWARSTKTTHQSPLPSCSATSWADTNPRRSNDPQARCRRSRPGSRTTTPAAGTRPAGLGLACRACPARDAERGGVVKGLRVAVVGAGPWRALPGAGPAPGEPPM